MKRAFRAVRISAQSSSERSEAQLCFMIERKESLRAGRLFFCVWQFFSRILRTEQRIYKRYVCCKFASYV